MLRRRSTAGKKNAISAPAPSTTNASRIPHRMSLALLVCTLIPTAKFTGSPSLLVDARTNLWSPGTTSSGITTSVAMRPASFAVVELSKRGVEKSQNCTSASGANPSTRTVIDSPLDNSRDPELDKPLLVPSEFNAPRTTFALPTETTSSLLIR